MITKEQIKKEIDRLPENVLDEVYLFLRSLLVKKESKQTSLTPRHFHGKLDQASIRKEAYE